MSQMKLLEIGFWLIGVNRDMEITTTKNEVPIWHLIFRQVSFLWLVESLVCWM